MTPLKDMIVQAVALTSPRQWNGFEMIRERSAILRKVLITDDRLTTRKGLRALMLTQPDIQVIGEAANGERAIQFIEKEKPDAILLDLMMPRLDGFGVLSQLRQDPATSDIPVIILTSKMLTAAEKAVLQASAQQVIQKQGLASEELLQELKQVLTSQ